MRKSERLETQEKKWLGEVGRRIRAIRDAAGLTGVTFGELVGTTGPTVSRWESGELIPDAVDVYRISQQFNVPIKALFDSYETQPRADFEDVVQDRLTQIETRLDGIVVAMGNRDT